MIPARLALVALKDPEGVVTARRVAREAAAALGFASQDQTRIATAVSELARNAFLYARGGRMVLELDDDRFTCRVEDDGPGIIDLPGVIAGSGGGRGVLGVKRLADDFDLRSGPQGTRARFTKALPAAAAPVDPVELRGRLHRRNAADAQEELELQNRELLAALGALRARQEELVALNRELDDTNRGGVALHHELDVQAERDRMISRMLQRSLMPERLATAPGVEIVADHRSAGAGALVGGDFYDVIDLGPEELWLFMGDVAGHGVETAAKANELRQSLRIYAREGYSPEASFSRLNDLVLGDDLVALATACVVRLDVRHERVDVVVAGHPAPMLLAPGEAPRLLTGGSGPLLGLPGFTWTARSHPFPRGSRLVLYTDGLIERVGETLDEGFARLLAAGAELPDDGAAAVRDLFAILPPDEELRDDVAVLLARSEP